MISKRPSLFVLGRYETVQESDEPLPVQSAITKLELSAVLFRNRRSSYGNPGMAEGIVGW